MDRKNLAALYVFINASQSICLKIPNYGIINLLIQGA